MILTGTFRNVEIHSTFLVDNISKVFISEAKRYLEDRSE